MNNKNIVPIAMMIMLVLTSALTVSALQRIGGIFEQSTSTTIGTGKEDLTDNGVGRNSRIVGPDEILGASQTRTGNPDGDYFTIRYGANFLRLGRTTNIGGAECSISPDVSAYYTPSGTSLTFSNNEFPGEAIHLWRVSPWGAVPCSGTQCVNGAEVQLLQGQTYTYTNLVAGVQYLVERYYCTVTSCTCTQWTSVGCGSSYSGINGQSGSSYGPCKSTQMLRRQSCTPDKCQPEEVCVDWIDVCSSIQNPSTCSKCTQVGTCTDSDSGKDYYTKGTVTDKNNLDHIDYCDYNNIIEYYCSGSEYYSVNMFCQNGCVSGKCNPTTSCVPEGSTCNTDIDCCGTLNCNSQKTCITAECQNVQTQTCPDGSIIVTKDCIDFKYVPTGDICPTPLLDNGQPCDTSTICKSGYCNPSTYKCANQPAERDNGQGPCTAATQVEDCKSDYCNTALNQCAPKPITGPIIKSVKEEFPAVIAGNYIPINITIRNDGSSMTDAWIIEAEPSKIADRTATVTGQGVCDPAAPQNVHIGFKLDQGETATLSFNVPAIQGDAIYKVKILSVARCCATPAGCLETVGPYGWGNEKILSPIDVDTAGVINKCSDGTPYGICSDIQKPFLCSNSSGQLVPRCGYCGACPGSETCLSDGRCQLITNQSCDASIKPAPSWSDDLNKCGSYTNYNCTNGKWTSYIADAKECPKLGDCREIGKACDGFDYPFPEYKGHIITSQCSTGFCWEETFNSNSGECASPVCCQTSSNKILRKTSCLSSESSVPLINCKLPNSIPIDTVLIDEAKANCGNSSNPGTASCTKDEFCPDKINKRRLCVSGVLGAVKTCPGESREESAGKSIPLTLDDFKRLEDLSPEEKNTILDSAQCDTISECKNMTGFKIECADFETIKKLTGADVDKRDFTSWTERISDYFGASARDGICIATEEGIEKAQSFCRYFDSLKSAFGESSCAIGTVGGIIVLLFIFAILFK